MVPVIASAADIPAAVDFAQNHPEARWYVTRRIEALGEPDDIPAEWGAGVVPITASRQPKLGTGKRFSKLKTQLAGRGVRNPGALAAYIGRKKYGAKKFGSLAAKARTAAVTADAGQPTAGWLRRVRAELTEAGMDPDYVEATLGGGFTAAYDGSTDAVAYAEMVLDGIIADLADEFPELLADDAGDSDPGQPGDDAGDGDPAPDTETDGDGDAEGEPEQTPAAAPDDGDDEEDKDPAVPVPAPAVQQVDPAAPAPAPVPVAASANGPLVVVQQSPGQSPVSVQFDTAALTAAIKGAVSEELRPLLAARMPDDPDPAELPGGLPDDVAAAAPDGLDPDADGDVDIPGSPLDVDGDAAALQAPDATADMPPDDAAAPAVNLDDAKAALRARFGKARPVAASGAKVLTASAMRARIAQRATAAAD